jgi:beta-glucosidase
MARHNHTLWRAVNFNWPVRGYYNWTLVDCFEWDAGWSKPYGLWALDRSTQARKKRPSAAFYADIARHNAVRSESVAEYAPEAFDALYPPRGAAELITEQR